MHQTLHQYGMGMLFFPICLHIYGTAFCCSFFLISVANLSHALFSPTLPLHSACVCVFPVYSHFLCRRLWPRTSIQHTAHYLLPIQIFAFASLSAYEILSGFHPHSLLPLCIFQNAMRPAGASKENVQMEKNENEKKNWIHAFASDIRRVTVRA